MKKFIALLLAAVMALSVLAGCGNSTTPDAGKETTAASGNAGTTTVESESYTYNTYMSALATNWNPHTWEMNNDNAVMGYIEAPLTDISVKDGETGEYQWIFVAAKDIKDVTAEHQDDLTKYNVMLPAGKTADQVTDSYVYEISLREEMCWQDGTPINADTYIYSMQQMLAPEMKNYRANNYYSGESALAGAFAYYNQGSKIYDVVVPAYTDTPDYSLDITAYDTYVNVSTTGMTIASYSFYQICNDYGYIAADTYKAVADLADADGYVKITADNKEAVLKMMDEYLSAFGLSIYNEDATVNEELYKEFLLYDTGKVSEAVSFDTVGLYKVDDYTIRYVCEAAYDYYYFLTSCTSNWLVHEEMYEACKTVDEATGLVTSNYNTSVDTTMAYGPYKLTVLEDAKQMVFVQNENYWEYTKNADGTLSSTTFFEVDGAYIPQYQTQKIVINVMTDDAAKLAFLSGELDDWSLPAEDAITYSTSEQLYQVDETYTMRLFFHTNLDSLKKMDTDGTNINGVVLSNTNFRKAFSLAIDRAEFVTATAGFKPAFFLINSLYYYDVYEDPASIYRNTDAAKQAVLNIYGVEYGAGTAYADLDAAYDSITGYNLTEAQALMATACDELVAAGLYKEGDAISIKIALSAGAQDAADQSQMAMLNAFINEAAKGSGFGTIELIAVDNLNNRYADVANGVYAVGRGAWGGAAFYPFTMFRVYCDPSYADIHEIGCYDPSTETLTLNVNGEDVTMTWQEWSVSMTGTGRYADADNETKLVILAGIEENFLEQYYCIPLCTYTACSMLSYKLNYHTEVYSIMYGFGGLRLMNYNYSDAEWADYVASQGGTVGY